MHQDNKEEAPKTKDSPQLEWPARLFFALISAPAIGLAVGLLTAIDVSGVDGEMGYTVLYNGAIFTGLAFLALLFIGSKRIHIVLASVAAVAWIVALFNL